LSTTTWAPASPFTTYAIHKTPAASYATDGVKGASTVET